MQKDICSLCLKQNNSLKKAILLLIIVLAICSLSYGQRTPLIYNMAVGLRGAYDIGINYRQFLSDHIAIEGLISHELNEPLGYKLTLTAQYQRNAKIAFGLGSSLVRIAWYVGAGAHVAYYKQFLYPIRGKLYEYYPTSVTPVGIDAVIGLEYRFKRIPLAIGVDARSYYEIYKPGDSFLDGGAFVRYVFD